MSNSVYSQEELKIVTGKVYDLHTKADLTTVTTTLYDQDHNSVAVSPVNSQGFYFFELEGIDNSYRVKAEAQGYTAAEVAVKFSNGNPTSRMNFGLYSLVNGHKNNTGSGKPKELIEVRGVKDVIEVIDVTALREAKGATAVRSSAEVSLDPIYFDFNSSYLNENNIKELNTVIEILRANPTMKIEVRAHADTRGSIGYNNWLAERRANRTADWIIQQGKINPSRIITKDYGKTQPINECPPGVNCSEGRHLENRRCEFIVL
ncbi:OmpA family protein [Flavobacterium sp. HSC-61S13]|uniref:OmpA family protein n=1 Tax=Flavobacterium sp. HSC-61S13 TaxID=2910963 RepID=UPI00209F29EB|nr:OmpA family protein [Flavobacterium sp. HSC-61S13]MCP1996375.1 outer membrane protein OmpA-like peptidoglycan-associated protein [Flavobacterium sp. HSC-61S13]